MKRIIAQNHVCHICFQSFLNKIFYRVIVSFLPFPENFSHTTSPLRRNHYLEIDVSLPSMFYYIVIVMYP